MEDDTPPEDPGKQKSWHRLKGKLTSLKKPSTGGVNDHDVDDFLRPSSSSSEVSTHPVAKVDLTTAKNWKPSSAPSKPSLLSGSTTANITDKDFPFEKYRPIKPTRRPGLTVGFARGNPDVIGEGGDESEHPVITVARNRKPPSSHPPTSRSRRGTQDSLPQGRRSTEIPIIRKPLQRAPTGFGDENYPPEDSSREPSPSGASAPDARVPRKPVRRATGLQESDAPVRHKRDASDSSSEYPAPPPLSRGVSQDNQSIYAANDLSYQLNQTHSFSDSRSGAMDDRSLRPHYPSSSEQPQRSKTSPSRGLRRMRADEGLAHRAGSRSSYHGAPVDEIDRPSSKSNLEAPSFAQHSQSPSNESDRASSAHSFNAPSPQPADYASRFRPPPPDSTSQQSSYFQPFSPSPTSQNAIPPPLNVASQKRTQPEPEDLERRVPESTFRPQVPPPEVSRHNPKSSSVGSIRASHEHPRSEADVALREFTSRVSGASSIFNLAVEAGKTEITISEWLRAALWWFLRGRSGLEQLARSNRPGSAGGSPSPARFDRLTAIQHYLNLAKACWIVLEVIPDQAENRVASGPADNETVLQTIAENLKRLTASMMKRDLMPPPEMLVQGLDSRIWLPPTRTLFSPEWLWILGGKIFKAPDDPSPIADPLSSMPIGDTDQISCSGRAFAQMVVSSGDEPAKHEPFPCVITIIQNRTTSEPEMILSSQGPHINVTIRGTTTYGIHWEHTRWDAEDNLLRIKLPQKLRLRVYLVPADFKLLHALLQKPSQSQSQPRPQPQTRISTSLRPRRGERILQEFSLGSFQFTDTQSPHSFPPDRIRSCRLAVFEKLGSTEGTSPEMQHMGYRVSIMTTEPASKQVDIDLGGTNAPLEYAFDAKYPDMQMRLNDPDRCRRAFLGFQSVQQRDMFRDLVSGTYLGTGDSVKLNLSLQGIVFSRAEMPTNRPPISLRWDYLQVIEEPQTRADRKPHDADVTNDLPNIRLMMYDQFGCLVSRLHATSVSPASPKIRLEAQTPRAFQILHSSSNTGNSLTIGPELSNVNQFHEVYDLLSTGAYNIHTFAFHDISDLHTFETALTGYRVLFDGVSSTFTIPRRRMMVPIYKSFDASNTRIQVVEKDGLTRLLAFFDGYDLTDCLNFIVKSTDSFERVDGVKPAKTHSAADEKESHRAKHKSKGSEDHNFLSKGGGNHFGVKLVDAKFVLPGSGLDDEDLRNGVGVVRSPDAKFTSVETETYAAEHEDITVSFESEEGKIDPLRPLLLHSRNQLLTSTLCRARKVRGGVAGTGDESQEVHVEKAHMILDEDEGCAMIPLWHAEYEPITCFMRHACVRDHKESPHISSLAHLTHWIASYSRD